MASAEFLRNVKSNLSLPGEDPPEIQYQPNSYLFLATEDRVEQIKENNRLQKDLGAKVELLTAKQLKENFPWLNTDGIAIGSLGLENEGRFDPHSLLSAFQKKAIANGTAFVNGEVVGFKFKNYHEGEEPLVTVNYLLVKTDDGEIREVEFSILVIAAGPSSGEIAKMLGIGTGKGILQFPLPVQPRKRYVYFYHCPDGPTLDFPMLIDSSGAYATREGLGGYYLAGKSPSESEEPDNNNLDVDHQYFDRCVWPLIANRVPAFEALKVKSAWAGYYDYNYFDENGIVGCHPYYGNVIFATGFSGHGIQMAPAVGKAVMELILDREYTSINLRNFGFQRIIEGIPLIENHCV
ncbi:FAD-dependent oxidoreductase domain-containing protein 1 isoform X2 [Centruroides vittatus]